MLFLVHDFRNIRFFPVGPMKMNRGIEHRMISGLIVIGVGCRRNHTVNYRFLLLGLPHILDLFTCI